MSKQRIFQSLATIAAVVFIQVGLAQAPAGAPAGSTGLCKDGTYYSGATKQGACRGHKGVQQWWGGATDSGKAAPAAKSASNASPKTASPAAAAPAASPAPAAAAAPARTPAATPAPTRTPAKPSTAAAAPGGGAGKVWLNSASNVYHCEGSRYYGTTKTGAYMTEAEAQAKGARPDRGKPCK